MQFNSLMNACLHLQIHRVRLLTCCVYACYFCLDSSDQTVVKVSSNIYKNMCCMYHGKTKATIMLAVKSCKQVIPPFDHA